MKKVIAIVLVACFLLYVIICLLTLSKESWVVVFLNHVAVTQPKSCDPQTNFQVHPRMKPDLTLDYGEDGYLVPNIVHYIWYTQSPKKFHFEHMLSVLSAHKYIKPSVIYLYCNLEPTGKYWERVKKEVPELQLVFRKPVTCVHGVPITNPVFGPSSSDLERVTLLMEKGGIYLDLDVLVVKSFNPIRNFSCTVGRESEKKMNSGVLIANKDSPFLRLWLEHYIVDYKVWMWNYNAGWVPAYLADRYPAYIHIENTSLQRPNGDEQDKIFGDTEFDWSDNYSIHLLTRTWRNKHLFIVDKWDEDYIMKHNNTFSKLARRILGIKS